MKSVTLVFTAILLLFMTLPQPGCKSRPVTRVHVSDDSVDTAEPAVATDADGNLYVAYIEHAEDKTADLYVHKYTPSLEQAGTAVQINPLRGSAKAWAGDP